MERPENQSVCKRNSTGQIEYDEFVERLIEPDTGEQDPTSPYDKGVNSPKRAPPTDTPDEAEHFDHKTEHARVVSAEVDRIFAMALFAEDFRVEGGLLVILIADTFNHIIP